MDDNHRPPTRGPRSDIDSVTWGTADEILWMEALIAAVRDFRIFHPVVDPATHIEYRNTDEFVEDLTGFLTNRPSRDKLKTYLRTMKNILAIAHGQRAQAAFTRIELNLQLLEIANTKALEGTEGVRDYNFDSDHPGNGPDGEVAAALQWTAIERLLDLLNK